MYKRFPFYIGLGFLFALLVSPACYTLFKHPRVKRVVYEEVNDNRCNTCHGAEELWSFHHPGNLGYGYGWTTDYDPWWYNDYWYYPDDGTVTVPLHYRSFRPSADRPGATMGTAPQPADSPLSSPARASSNSDKGSSNEQPSKKRTVRPAKDKESKHKEKGKE